MRQHCVCIFSYSVLIRICIPIKWLIIPLFSVAYEIRDCLVVATFVELPVMGAAFLNLSSGC